MGSVLDCIIDNIHKKIPYLNHRYSQIFPICTKGQLRKSDLRLQIPTPPAATNDKSGTIWLSFVFFGRLLAGHGPAGWFELKN
jgi:hypothetical protein